MTPAINAAKQAGIAFTVHEYEHNPAVRAYGEEAATALGISTEQVFKTLVAALNENHRQLAVAVVPVARQLDLKAFAAASGAKKVILAETKAAERITGYIVGGISPLGQRRWLPMIVDESALAYSTIYVSAGKRGLEIELAPQDLIRLCKAKAAKICK